MIKNKKKHNIKKKGFTLIELLAVIVILGILMVIAIPAVTRYIEKSKKEAFIKEINSLVDTVRYGITSNDSKYSMNGETTNAFDLSKIDLENGKKTSLTGTLTVNTKDNTYTVKVTGSKYNYCLPNRLIEKIDLDSVIPCQKMSDIEYHISKGEYENQKISFAGSNWYVINDSTYADDFVTVMKETVLTNSELGEYAYQSSDSMSYYWDNNCHPDWYGYNDYVQSNCDNRNNYKGSKVQEMLEEHYVKLLGEDNLVVVNDYKIRLIKAEELINNFDYFNDSASEKTPSWLKGLTSAVWTMTPYSNSTYTYIVKTTVYNGLSTNTVIGSSSVRPVINLKKSVIDNL